MKKKKYTCFWCNKKFVNLIKHTEKQHPLLDIRSYDLPYTKPIKGQTINLIICEEK